MLTGIYFLKYNFLTAVNVAFKINSVKEKLLTAPNNSLLWGKKLLLLFIKGNRQGRLIFKMSFLPKHVGKVSERLLLANVRKFCMPSSPI